MKVKQRLYYSSPQIILILGFDYAPVSIMPRTGFLENGPYVVGLIPVNREDRTYVRYHFELTGKVFQVLQL